LTPEALVQAIKDLTRRYLAE